MSQRILVWDVPTRVFHWLLVLSFGGAFLTAESERYRDIHVVLGYTLLGLIAFRLLWGFLGTRYAQFRSFLFKPGEIVAYVRSLFKDKPVHYVGHNPAGSVAIWLLLGLGISSGVTGVMSLQDIGGEVVKELHEFVSNAMLAVVVIHIAGVVVSSLMHRENLLLSMVTGFKSAEPNGHGIDASTNNETHHARFPHPNPTHEPLNHLRTSPLPCTRSVLGRAGEGAGLRKIPPPPSQPSPNTLTSILSRKRARKRTRKTIIDSCGGRSQSHTIPSFIAGGCYTQVHGLNSGEKIGACGLSRRAREQTNRCASLMLTKVFVTHISGWVS